jgi:Ran GTPase-activating protein (RanGAP) involved in mRNA processing and transport
VICGDQSDDDDEDSDDDYKIKYDGLMRHYPIYSALLLFHSLKEFKLDNDPDTSFYADDVIKALNGHTCLRKLSLSGVIIEMKGFNELASMRQNPLSNLTTLHLHDCNIDSDGMIFFAGCLSSYSTLKELTISSPRGKYGWQPILFTALQRSNLKLTRLDFSGNRINNVDARSLSKTLLCHNATIKNLSLCALGNPVMNAGWSDIFESLRSTDSALETLNLSGNTITNGILITLERALINNSRLRELCFQGNSSVTPKGWKTLSRVLRNPNSSLEILDLRNNRMSDKVVVSFAEALANNHRLRELKLDLYYKRISNFTSDGLAAFNRVLCDNTSITNTYYSNHTLERIFGDIREVTFDIEDLYSLLRMNNESNKFEVARLKIIMEHFSGSEINMQIFADMELNVRPHAIAWMAQDNHLLFGVLEEFTHDNHLYSFLRTLPSLLERQRPSQNLRKRSCQ